MIENCNFNYAGTYQQKRRKIAPVKVWDVESEQEEHSLSLSQHSSPSQSDQEQTQAQKANASAMDSHRVKLIHKIPSNWQHGSVSSYKRVLKNVARRSPQDLHHLEYQPTQERYLHVDDDINRGRHQAAEHKPMARGYAQQLVVDRLLSQISNFCFAKHLAQTIFCVFV